MKFKRFLAFSLVILGILGMLAGCGSSNSSNERPMAQQEAPMEQEMAGDALASGSSNGAIPLPDSRKWIVTVQLQAETEDLDALLASVLDKITALGGYVQNQDIYNGSGYSDYRYRSASLTLRIPAEKAEEFTDTVGKEANVVSNSRQVEDVTLQYVDTESRLAALKTEEARLLELLEQAESMADLLEIEARLTEVRYELESVTSQKRTYDNQIDYATVYLAVDEVREYTPVEEPTVWERISGGFVDNLQALGEGLLDFIVWFLAGLPLLVPLAGVIWLAVWLRRRYRKKHPKMPKVPKQ